jgi:hypothetical protein
VSGTKEDLPLPDNSATKISRVILRAIKIESMVITDILNVLFSTFIFAIRLLAQSATSIMV